MNGKALALIASMLLLLSILPVAYALGEGVTDQKAEIIINILNKAREKAEGAISSLEANNITVPEELLSLYKQGLNLSEQAISLYNQAKYEQAVKLAIEAMNTFKEVVKRANELLERAEKRIVDAEKAVGLRVAINRTYLFIEEVESLASKAREEGYNVTAVEELIAMAKEHLANATLKLDEGDINGAAKELASARGIIGKAMGLVHALTKGIEEKRAISFVEKAIKRLEDVKAKIEASKVSERAKSKILSALEEAKKRVEMVKPMLESKKDMASAMKVLCEFKHKEEEVIKDIEEESHELAKLTRETMGLHAKALNLKDEIEKLAAKGFNASIALGTLEQAMRIIGNASAPSEDMVERAREMLKEVERFMHRVREEAAERKSKLQSLIAELEERISEIKSKLEQVRGNVTKEPQLEEKLQAALSALEKARDKLEAGMVVAAEEAVRNSSKIVEEVEEEIERVGEMAMPVKPPFSEREVVDKLAELVKKWQELKERMAGMPNVKPLLDKAWALLEEAKEEIAKKELDEAKALINQINDLLSQIEKMPRGQAEGGIKKWEGKPQIPPQSPRLP